MVLWGGLILCLLGAVLWAVMEVLELLLMWRRRW